MPSHYINFTARRLSCAAPRFWTSHQLAVRSAESFGSFNTGLKLVCTLLISQQRYYRFNSIATRASVLMARKLYWPNDWLTDWLAPAIISMFTFHVTYTWGHNIPELIRNWIVLNFVNKFQFLRYINNDVITCSALWTAICFMHVNDWLECAGGAYTRVGAGGCKFGCFV